jgi:hypothetical protein
MLHFALIVLFVIVWLALNAAMLPAWPWIARRMRDEADDEPAEPAQRSWNDRRTGEWS